MSNHMIDGIDKLLTVEEVMETLRISRPTLYRLLKSDMLIPVRIGKRTLFDQKDIRSFVEASKNVSKTQTQKNPPKQKKHKSTNGASKKHKETTSNEQNVETPIEEHKHPKSIINQSPDPAEGQGRLL